MEQNNSLGFRIIHIILNITGITIFTYLFINDQSNDLDMFVIVTNCINILTLIFGLIYALMSYKKNIRILYKLFMISLVVGELCDTIIVITQNELSLTNLFIYLLSLVLFTLLAGSRDYGFTKSFLLIIGLIIVRVISILGLLPVYSSKKELVASELLLNIGQLVLVATTSLMIFGKYIDKNSRGTE